MPELLRGIAGIGHEFWQTALFYKTRRFLVGIFSSLFGGKKPEPAELYGQGGQFLNSLEDMLYNKGDWKAALKLYRKSPIFDELIGEGGALEHQFFKIAFDLLTKERESQKLATLASPEEIKKQASETQFIIRDDTLNSVEDFCARTDFASPGSVWLALPGSEKEVDPLKRINAMYTLAAQPDIVGIFLDDGMPMLLRKSFLKEAVEEFLDADTQIEDLGQDLMDYAQSRKLVLYNIWGR